MADELEVRSSFFGFAGVERAHKTEGADNALVRAAQNGDRSAFGMLYDRYARMVHGVLLSKVSYAEAEDLVQDVFLQALSRLDSLRDVSRFGAWLAAIARNRAFDFLRRVRPMSEFEEELHIDREGVSRVSESAHTEAALVLEVIRSLPKCYREPLILRLVEGMTGPEIAARTGLTEGSVRVNLHRGMNQLRESLGRRSIIRHSAESNDKP